MGQMRLRTNKTMRKIICLTFGAIIGLSASVPAQLYGQSVQRLFSTPAARAELDRRRFQIASGIVIEQPTANERFPEVPVVTDEEVDVIYAIGGTLRRADGSYTVWINNTAYDQESLPAHMEMLSPYSQGQLLIRDTTSGASFRVKPGQVLNLSTGDLYESYQYQQIVAAAAEAARIAAAQAVVPSQGTGSAILDSTAVEAVLEAAQDL